MKPRALLLLVMLLAIAGSTAAAASFSAISTTTTRSSTSSASSSPRQLAAATPRHDRLPLHAGSAGRNVSKLQYLIRDPRPRQNPWRQIRGTFKGQPNGYFGARTKSAVIRWKYRFGFPARKGQCGAPVDLVIPTAGATFFAYLQGHRIRPACWAALAASRLKAVNTGPTDLATKAKVYELELLAAGIHEIPDGSNRGPGISYTATFTVDGQPFRPAPLQSATGAYGLAWCVSTQQAVFRAIGYGTFLGDTAGVYDAVDQAARGKDGASLSAKAKVGALVAFITYDRRGRRVPGTGHMGFVMKVEASGFTYNAGNDGNAYRQHTIPFGSRSYTFIYLRNVA